jgi:ABC-type lipoprotein release transport system permease subunit
VLTLAIGIGANTAIAFMRLMSSMLFAVSPVDPMTYAMVSLMLMAAAALASYVPAMRASAVDPLEALRAE